MATHDEHQRIAAALNALRPDWRVTSLVTYLDRHHQGRPYRDLAIAATAVATDPKTTTPHLLGEHGAWWAAAQTVVGATSTPLRAPRCPVDGHSSYLADRCGACRTEDIVAPDVDDPPTPRRVGAPIPPAARAVLDALPRPTGGTR